GVKELRCSLGVPCCAIKLIRSLVQVCQRVGKDSIFFFFRGFDKTLLHSGNRFANLSGSCYVGFQVGRYTVLYISRGQSALIVNNNFGELKDQPNQNGANRKK